MLEYCKCYFFLALAETRESEFWILVKPLVDSQDGVRHPDKGTDKTILLISRHYWRPAQENGRMEGRTGALPLPPRRLIAHHDQQQQQLLCKRSLASCCSKKDPLFIYEHH